MSRSSYLVRLEHEYWRLSDYMDEPSWSAPLGVYCSLLPLEVLLISLCGSSSAPSDGTAFRLTVLNMCLQRVVPASAPFRSDPLVFRLCSVRFQISASAPPVIVRTDGIVHLLPSGPGLKIKSSVSGSLVVHPKFWGV